MNSVNKGINSLRLQNAKYIQVHTPILSVQFQNSRTIAAEETQNVSLTIIKCIHTSSKSRSGTSAHAL